MLRYRRFKPKSKRQPAAATTTTIIPLEHDRILPLFADEGKSAIHAFVFRTNHPPCIHRQRRDPIGPSPNIEPVFIRYVRSLHTTIHSFVVGSMAGT